MNSSSPPRRECGTLPCADSPASCSLSRRDFLQVVAGSLGVALLAGCDHSDSTRRIAPPVAAVAVGNEWKIPGAAALEPGQAMAFEWPSKTPGLVFVTKAGELRAISAKCTHAGCTVQWQDKGELFCPCHGSRFDLSGKVLLGPATAPLPTYGARKDGNDVLIQSKS